LALDLKRMLTNQHKEDHQSVEDYLRVIKTIADSEAAIQSPVSDLELIQFTTAGLPPEYDTFVNTFSMMPGSYSFDDLRSK